MKRLVLGMTMALAACGGGDDGGPRPIPTPLPTDQLVTWDLRTITPDRPGGYAVNMPAHPTVAPDGSWWFEFGPDREPHYVTTTSGPLTAKAAIRVRFRAEAAPGTVIYGKGCAITSPGTVTAYFQRAGDDWNTDGWRWWATFATVTLAGPGEHQIVAPLDGPWTSVIAKTAASAPGDFAEAKRRTGRVGFTFGNCEGYGHGVRATAPVRFVVTSFEVLDQLPVGERG